MRNPARIEPLLARLRRVWQEHPDLRFGQLVSILDSKRSSGANQFNAEDWDWDEAIERMARGTNPPGPSVEELEELRERGGAVSAERIERARRASRPVR